MQILAITIPIFIFVAVGFFSKEKGFIGGETRNFLNKFVYYITFPALTFKSIVSFDFASTFRLNLVACNVTATCCIFVLTFFIALLIKQRLRRGAFNMSCFRSNQGYMGLPIINGFYGEQAMSRAAVINGFDSPTVIILSVIALEIFKGKGRSNKEKTNLRNALNNGGERLFFFFSNPFIFSAFLGLIFSYYKVPVLKIDLLDKLLGMTGNMSLPLALILIGCSIEIKKFQNNLKLVLTASFVKLLVMPLTAFLIAYFLFHFRGADLGMSVIITAMPSAVSTYVMAAEMETDAELAATIIGFTTFVSVITISIVQFLLVKII